MKLEHLRVGDVIHIWGEQTSVTRFSALGMPCIRKDWVDYDISPAATWTIVSRASVTTIENLRVGDEVERSGNRLNIGKIGADNYGVYAIPADDLGYWRICMRSSDRDWICVRRVDEIEEAAASQGVAACKPQTHVSCAACGGRNLTHTGVCAASSCLPETPAHVESFDYGPTGLQASIECTETRVRLSDEAIARGTAYLKRTLRAWPQHKGDDMRLETKVLASEVHFFWRKK